MPKIKQAPKPALTPQKVTNRNTTMVAAQIPKGLMSCCATAYRVAMGIQLSTATPAQWHGYCRRAVWNPGKNSLTEPCTCPCHAEQEWKCLTCRAEGTLINPLTGSCQNETACALRVTALKKAWWEEKGIVLTGPGEPEASALDSGTVRALWRGCGRGWGHGVRSGS
jgi:hypothetical protein